ncbi:relaxase/mobilization nuclease domain-containing protein [Pseudodonghicola sp.]|uniref:relaxase/mobilization nuclease domain-containing protein n=1 Tax=Pseudodonghicola sp. TaxID=1969463 RepID=UPI003A985F58
MILVASQRAGARALADHLMNDRDNDHVQLAELSGFMAGDLHGALDETHAISKATRCKQYLFSVSLNPPEDYVVSEEGFREAADRIAVKLGLSDQPRAMVIHEKNGRRHAHVVWSRIDAETITAINLPHFKTKLRDLSRELFLDHGWELPKGLKTYGDKDPLNFTLAEWQQAQRVGIDPREMKQLFREAWGQSDDLNCWSRALSDKGLYLAKGDRRGVVALDVHGNIYSLSRWSGVKSRDVKARLGDPADLPTVADVEAKLRLKKTEQVHDYIQQVKDRHVQDMQPFNEERAMMVLAQRQERADLNAKQEQRWIEETKARSDRLNKGLRGLFDRLTGAHRKTVQENERAAKTCAHRDQEQRDRLILAQMTERKGLQERAKAIKAKHRKDRALLAKTIAAYLRRPTVEHGASQTQHRSRGPSLDR